MVGGWFLQHGLLSCAHLGFFRGETTSIAEGTVKGRLILNGELGGGWARGGGGEWGAGWSKLRFESNVNL